MQEALISLFQMAKTSAVLERMRLLGIPYISVLTDPVYGGVSASLAMLGDLNVAEPNALIGFAGPRVIEQTVREKLPEGFQRAEFLLEHGQVDIIISRLELRDRLQSILSMMVEQFKLPEVEAEAVTEDEIVSEELNDESQDDNAVVLDVKEETNDTDADVVVENVEKKD